MLTSVALADVTAPDASPVTIGVGGRYARGTAVGRYAKTSCKFFGVTARATRRAARVSESERLLAAVEADLGAVDRDRAEVEAQLTAAAAAVAQLPAPAAVHTGLRELDRAAATLRTRQDASAAAATHLDQALVERAAAKVTGRRG
ncbi:hypothetical protein [Micromonospora sp. WMMD737]|uniref:hypothetical protein n=1 Tax=Micromonospora sp. WMMD737 TaxID=3404113 RepID=UPI003B9549D0